MTCHMDVSPLLNMRRRNVMAMVGLTWLGPLWAAEAMRKPWPGKRRLPKLQLPMQSGETWRLAEQKGRPVLLNFWASWCEPCRSEMPTLEAMAQRYKAQGLQVMAVNFRESASSVQRFVDTTALQLPVLRDDGECARVFGVHVFPSTVAIQRNGEVLFTVVGECDWSSPAANRWVSEIL